MQKKKPNILLITTDQQRFDTIYAAGNRHIRTPHLNWLAARGVRFSRCYSDAPLCVPARATIMTGRTGYCNNLTTNSGDVQPIDSLTSLPGRLAEAGYQTRAQGKMHFIPRRKNYGFEHMELLEDYYRYMAKHPEKGVPSDHGIGQNEMEPTMSTVPESYSLTSWTVDRSIDFLETRDDTRPFFLWTSFSKPHPPLDPCLNYWLMYQNAEVPDPVYGDWSENPDDICSGFKRPTAILNSCDRFDETLVREMRRAYYACITQIDYNLGRLFGRLREMGLLENTLILFTSDHGDMMGDHHLGAKQVFLEGSAHVPLLMRPPGGGSVERGEQCVAEGEVVPGSVCHDLANLTDIYATCLAAAGVEIPKDCTGMDLRRVAQNECKRDVFFGVSEDHFAIIRGNHKYTYCADGAGELLFDLDKDPYEQKNLAGLAEYAGLKKKLIEELTAEMARVRPEYLVNGKLPASAPSNVELRRGAWPGFHTPSSPSDVMH